MKSRPFITLAFCFTSGILYLVFSIAGDARSPFGNSAIAANLGTASLKQVFGPMQMPVGPMQVPGRIAHNPGPKIGIIQHGESHKTLQQPNERSFVQSEKSDAILRDEIIERRSNQMKRDGLSQKLELRRKCLRSERKPQRN